MSKGKLGMLPLSAVRGPRDELEERLAGEKGREWLDALKLFLRKENPWLKPGEVPNPPRFKVWKKVSMSEASRNELFVKLQERGIELYDNAREMIFRDGFHTRFDRDEMNLTRVSAADLGLDDGASLETFWSRALWYGLELCPPSLALHLALANHHPERKNINVWDAVFAMDPIGGSAETPHLFRAHYGGGKMSLSSVSETIDSWIEPEVEFCFVLPCKAERKERS